MLKTVSVEEGNLSVTERFERFVVMRWVTDYGNESMMRNAVSPLKVLAIVMFVPSVIFCEIFTIEMCITLTFKIGQGHI